MDRDDVAQTGEPLWRSVRAFLGRFVNVHSWTSQTGRSGAIQEPSRPDRTSASARLQLKEWRAANTSCVAVPHFNERGYMWAESIPQIQSAFNLMFLGVMIIVGVTAFYRWLRFLKLDLELCFQPLWRKADDAFRNPRVSDSAPSGSGLCVAAGNIVLRQHWTW